MIDTCLLVDSAGVLGRFKGPLAPATKTAALDAACARRPSLLVRQRTSLQKEVVSIG